MGRNYINVQQYECMSEKSFAIMFYRHNMVGSQFRHVDMPLMVVADLKPDTKAQVTVNSHDTTRSEA